MKKLKITLLYCLMASIMACSDSESDTPTSDPEPVALSNLEKDPIYRLSQKNFKIHQQ